MLSIRVRNELHRFNQSIPEEDHGPSLIFAAICVLASIALSLWIAALAVEWALR